jgi:hypothetical protein
VCKRDQNKSPEGDTSPKAGSDVSDFGWIAVSVMDEIRDDPSRDGNFTALIEAIFVSVSVSRTFGVLQYECGSENRRSILERGLEKLHFRRHCRILPGCSPFKHRLELYRTVFFETRESPTHEAESDRSYAKSDAVEIGPTYAI